MSNDYERETDRRTVVAAYKQAVRERDGGDGAPVETALDAAADDAETETARVEGVHDDLKKRGEVYVVNGKVRVTDDLRSGAGL